MSTKVKRSLKKSYSAKKNKLPEALSFLKDVTFYSIAEHRTGNNKKIIIEFQPRIIKLIIFKAKSFNRINREVECLQRDNSILKTRFDQLMGALELLARDYYLVERSQKEKIRPEDRSPKSYINLLQERGFHLQGLPIQGGHPTLGKGSR